MSTNYESFCSGHDGLLYINLLKPALNAILCFVLIHVCMVLWIMSSGVRLPECLKKCNFSHLCSIAPIDIVISSRKKKGQSTNDTFC